jgi:hypothetical protein
VEGKSNYNIADDLEERSIPYLYNHGTSPEACAPITILESSQLPRRTGAFIRILQEIVGHLQTLRGGLDQSDRPTRKILWSASGISMQCYSVASVYRFTLAAGSWLLLLVHPFFWVQMW